MTESDYVWDEVTPEYDIHDDPEFNKLYPNWDLEKLTKHQFKDFIEKLQGTPLQYSPFWVNTLKNDATSLLKPPAIDKTRKVCKQKGPNSIELKPKLIGVETMNQYFASSLETAKTNGKNSCKSFSSWFNWKLSRLRKRTKLADFPPLNRDYQDQTLELIYEPVMAFNVLCGNPTRSVTLQFKLKAEEDVIIPLNSTLTTLAHEQLGNLITGELVGRSLEPLIEVLNNASQTGEGVYIDEHIGINFVVRNMIISQCELGLLTDGRFYIFIVVDNVTGEKEQPVFHFNYYVSEAISHYKHDPPNLQPRACMVGLMNKVFRQEEYRKRMKEIYEGYGRIQGEFYLNELLIN